jgi:hypothetical protein
MIRRAIMSVPDGPTRKVLWTVLAETIRAGSNSRTNTYKLHLRRPGDRIDGEQVWTLFEDNLRSVLDRVAAYRRLTTKRPSGSPNVRIFCDDSRSAAFAPANEEHVILVTSPPYGDNQTTIPYGQFSYLAMRWIPAEDLHPAAAVMVSNTHYMDTASLGGSLRKVAGKAEAVAAVSPAFARMIETAGPEKARGLRKVSVFMADLLDAFLHMRASCPGTAHWVPPQISQNTPEKEERHRTRYYQPRGHSCNIRWFFDSARCGDERDEGGDPSGDQRQNQPGLRPADRRRRGCQRYDLTDAIDWDLHDRIVDPK